MNRIVLYAVANNGWVVPKRKAYKKARFRRKMGRYHDWHGFFKNGSKNNTLKHMEVYDEKDTYTI